MILPMLNKMKKIKQMKSSKTERMRKEKRMMVKLKSTRIWQQNLMRQIKIGEMMKSSVK